MNIAPIKNKIEDIFALHMPDADKVELILDIFFSKRTENTYDVRINEIIEIIGSYFKLPKGWIVCKTMKGEYMVARHIFRYVCKYSIPYITMEGISEYEAIPDHSRIHNSILKVVPSWSIGNKKNHEHLKSIEKLLSEKL